MNIEKEYVLEMKDITKHYGENTVLNGVSLSVKKGEIHALLGENGAGKSTLMNILFGMPVIHSTGGFEGKVLLDEKILPIYPEKAPENPDENLKQLTVKDILCMGSGMERLPEVTENWLQDYLAVPIKHRPGTAFQYNSVGSTLLCAIVERKTGIPTEEFLKSRLFDMIGIDSDNFLFERMPDGTVFGGGGVYATTEDNLRLMKLYKDGGVCDGKRILSEEYD